MSHNNAHWLDLTAKLQTVHRCLTGPGLRTASWHTYNMYTTGADETKKIAVENVALNSAKNHQSHTL